MKLKYAPLITGASGKFGGAIASPWRGISTVRSLPTRPNPTTPAQVSLRQLFANASRAWTVTQPYTRAAWLAAAFGKNLTARNAYLGAQLGALKDDVNLNDLIGTPFNLSAIPPIWLSIDCYPTHFDIVFYYAAPSLGWTRKRIIAYAIQNANWSAPGAIITQSEGSQAPPPNFCTIYGLVPATVYQVRGFLEYVTPNGATEYSASSKRVVSTLP